MREPPTSATAEQGPHQAGPPAPSSPVTSISALPMVSIAPGPAADATRSAAAWVLPALLVLTAFAAFASVLTGPSGLGVSGATGEARWLILAEIRLPRALLGLLVGGALGLSGAALQGYLRNPLAEPGIIGVSGGAALGAVTTIHTGAYAAFALALPLGGLLGAAAATALVVALAGERSGALTLVLAGIAVASIAGALTQLVLNLSANPFAAVEIVFWLMGSLADRSLVHVWLAAPPILAGAVLLILAARSLDALSLGEDAAANLGVDLARTRLIVVAGTALAVGAATAVSGTIGFVGLVVPHLLRPLVGGSPARLLVPSAVGGAALVLLADVAVRLVSPFADLRIGVLTALLGAPFFLWLVLRTRRELAP